MITFLDSNFRTKLEQPLTANSIVHEAYFESSDDGYAIMPNGAFISLVFGTYLIEIYTFIDTRVGKNWRTWSHQN